MTTSQIAPGDSSAWRVLEDATDQEWADGSALARALDSWRCDNALERVTLYSIADDGDLEPVQTLPAGKDPVAEVDGSETAGWLELPGRLKLGFERGATSPEQIEAGPLALPLRAGTRIYRMSSQLREQAFQESYKAVTLEALYDVGLAIGSTLNLDDLSEEILLRAVSLLDARVGALYLVRGSAYHLYRTIGGSALDHIDLDDENLDQLLGSGRSGERSLLPGTEHVLVVPVTADGGRKGLLAVGDKESRTGVGPFGDEDRRALSLFANQAAIALENAHLHRQALEKERLEREMELAAEIQRGILPKDMPRLGDIEIAGWNRPTRQVGGDYYGTVSLGDGRMGIVVADVTGKGMPAALLVSTLHSALHLLLDSVDLGVEMVQRLNQHIVESSSSNKFITMILAELDRNSRTIGFLNAGHNPGLLVRSAGTVEQLPPSGLPLGLMAGSSYTLDRITLDPGDLLCLYSDGITECEAPDEEEYGIDRLSSFLVDRRADPLSGIIVDLDKVVTGFAGGVPQGDDQTVVLARRTG